MCIGREQSYFEVQTICSVGKTKIMKVLTYEWLHNKDELE